MIVQNGFLINFRYRFHIMARLLPTSPLLCILLAYLITFVVPTRCSSQSNGFMFEQFNAYVKRYNKEYLTNSTEFFTRFKIFKDNIAHATYMNKEYNSSNQPVYGINKFSDLTPQEFRALYLTGLKRNGCLNKKFSSAVTPKDLKSLGIPQKFDWREKGVLTGIRDQGTCGACWSFSIVETMESMYAIMYNSSFSVPELSIQQLIDCDHGNSACKGGDICEASKWSKQHGVVNASLYPLTDRSDNCKTLPDTVPRIYVQNYSCNSFIGKETEMLKLLVDRGPIAAAVDATTWHNYIGGIIQFHCSDHINHAVQIVGYDLTGDVPFYIIRNSWGTDFGDHGFIYVKFGENLCGLSIEVSNLNVTRYQ